MEEEEDIDVVTFLQKAGEQYRHHVKLLREEKVQSELATLRSNPVICPYERITDRDRGKVGERLHKLWERRKSNEQALREKADEQRKEAEKSTFRPKVTGAAKQLPPRGTQAHISKEFLKRHSDKVERLRADALQKEMEEVGPRARSASRTSTTEGTHRHGLKVEDYLLLKEKQRQNRLYELAETKIQGKPRISDRAKKCDRPGDVVSRLYDPNHRPVVYDENPPTFHPQIHSYDYDDPLEELPVHERVGRREVKHQSRIADVDRTPVGKPRLSTLSRSMVESVRESQRLSGAPEMSPGSRLYSEGMEAKRKQLLHAETERDATKKFTYKPKVSEESNKIVAKKYPQATTREEMHARWKKKEIEKKRRCEQLLREQKKSELKECTFTPNRGVSPISQAHQSQDFSGWMERSAMWDRQRQSKLHHNRVERVENELEHCTFQPLIHHEIPVSQPKKKASGVGEHVERLKVAREEEAFRQEQMECGGTTPARKREANQTPRRAFHQSADSTRSGSNASSRQGTPVQPRNRRVDPYAIDSLKPPVDRYDVPDPYDDEEDEESFHVQGPAARQSKPMPLQQPTLTPRRVSGNRGSQGRQSTASSVTASSSRGSYNTPGRGLQPNPSPIDYVLENHHAIVRGFRR